MHKLFLASIAVGYVLTQPALACEPCTEIWGTNKAIKEASHIIIGHRTTPKGAQEDKRPSGPAYVSIAVESVLKGNITEKEITTDAWHGMCQYGIVTQPGARHVMLLTKRKDTHYYQPLNHGCAVKVLAIDEQQNITSRDGHMTLEQLQQMIK